MGTTRNGQGWLWASGAATGWCDLLVDRPAPRERDPASGRDDGEMRRSSRLVRRGIAIALGALMIATGSAAARPPAGGPSQGGFSSDNVEWLGTVPLPPPGFPTVTSGKLIGRYFYVTGLDGIAIFDVSDPPSPRLLSTLRFPGDMVAHEDVDTNGRILVTSVGTSPSSGTGGSLVVIDVSDKENPRVVSRVPQAAAHTYTCLLDCRWAYAGDTGLVVDLRDPSDPKVSPRRWNAGLPAFAPPLVYTSGGAHDVTEIRPGIVLTASVPMYLLDARKDPTRPRLMAQSDGSPHSFGGVAWPNNGRDAIGLSWSESYQPPRCEIRDAANGTSFESAFKTWDMRDVKTGLITGRDRYYVRNGTYVDGEPAYSGGPPGFAGCSASWFEPHPNFSRGGLVALAATSHGVKFLDVDRRGRIEEVGYFLPHNGNAVSAYWITDRIVYSTDAYRGIDILRFTRSR